MSIGPGLMVALTLFLSVIASPLPALAQQGSAPVLIEEIEVRGNRRIPRETILYSINSKPGDVYDEAAVKRDFESILNIGSFDPMTAKLEIADGPRGGKIVIFEVKEYPLIRAIEYRNLKSSSESEVLTRFKERHVGIGKESPLDPVKAHGAGRVLQELIAEKGHPDATVELEIEEISATSVVLVFNVAEGKRVRIKEIEFTGDYRGFTQRRLRKAMQLVKEAGLLSSLTSKDIYHREKLLEDLDRVRFFLNTKGYLQAKVGEPKISPAGIASNGFPLPVPGLRKRGPGLKIVIDLEIGRRYKITRVEEKGVTIFQPGIVTAVSRQKVGEYADAKLIQENVYKGIKDLYGTQGYIQANVDFIPKFIDKTEEEGEVEITLEVDEGRQFSLRRLEFIGNTHTRDKVMRREVLLNEGDPYSKRLWDLSVLRLNQLGLFEEVKDKDAITRTNDRDQTVDIDLQVKERGRQQIQLNGGVSGYTGSFFGINYTTNNLFGFGQTLSLGISGGNRQLSASVGFTEPYFLGKPVSFGIELFAQKQKYLSSLYQYEDLDSLFTQRVAGGSVSLSAPLSLFTKRFRELGRFTRLGLSYSLSTSSVEDPEVNQDDDTSNDVPVTYRQPRILTSRITPSIFYNTLNSALDPTRGQSLALGLSFAGGALGGDVNLISPTFEYKFFRPVRHKESDRPHVFGMRFSFGHVRTFGRISDKIANNSSLGFIGGIPITERYFLGGENDVRGYNVFSIAPVSRSDSFRSTRNIVAQVPDSSGNLVDVDDGSVQDITLRRYQYDAPEGGCGEVSSFPDCNVERIVDEDSNGNEIPDYRVVGGDSRLLLNMEYRMPLAGPVSLAGFMDVGTVFNMRRYDDQVVATEFVNGLLTPDGVIINPSGLPLQPSDLDYINSYQGELIDGLPPGYRRIYLQGDLRTYNLLRLSQMGSGFRENMRASVGVEFRVQVPFLNVPFRLIFAYNPMANPDITDPKIKWIERRTVMRFSIGRTF